MPASFKSAEPGPTPIRSGFLYVIYHPGSPSYSKIGKAAKPIRRLAAANTWSPTEQFKLVGAVHFTDADTAERAAHFLLRDRRTRGEWFKLWPEEALALLHGLRRREVYRNR